MCRPFKTRTVGVKESELCSHHRSEAFVADRLILSRWASDFCWMLEDKTLKVGFFSETGGLFGLSGSGPGTSILRDSQANKSSERHLCTRFINPVLFSALPLHLPLVPQKEAFTCFRFCLRWLTPAAGIPPACSLRLLRSCALWSVHDGVRCWARWERRRWIPGRERQIKLKGQQKTTAGTFPAPEHGSVACKHARRPLQMHHLTPLNIRAFLATDCDTSEAADVKVSLMSQKMCCFTFERTGKRHQTEIKQQPRQRTSNSFPPGNNSPHVSLTEPSTVKCFVRILWSKYAHCVICFCNPESFQQIHL